MAFAARGLNCIAVGPTKLYTYYTTDTLTLETAQLAFNTTNCPNMAVGDIIMIGHNTNAAFAVEVVTAIATTACSLTAITALG